MASPGPRPANHKTIRKKKTRELPNLSDCHACKNHTNSTNPRNRLRILNSQWRIVLLCKVCYDLVESAKLCSYCLTDLPAVEDSGADNVGSVHPCGKCHRQMHISCVSRYSGFAPFSFLPPASELGNRDISVCIDCWMPKLLDNKLRGADSKRKVKAGSDSCSPGISRVSDCQGKPKSVEEVVNDADCVAQKKALNAEAAKDDAVMEAEVARGELDEKCSDTCDMVDCYDKRLALQLHRAMNSSPRIARSLLLSSKSCTQSSKPLELNGDSTAGKLSRLDRNFNALESQALLETGSSKSMRDDSSAGKQSRLNPNLNALESQALMETSSNKSMRDDSSAGKQSRLNHNLNALESQALMETSSNKSINDGCEGNSGNLESQSCNKEYVVVCGLTQNGRRHTECDRFFKKYCRRAPLNS